MTIICEALPDARKKTIRSPLRAFQHRGAEARVLEQDGATVGGPTQLDQALWD